MFRNYLASALRNLARNKVHAAINIVGLAAGFAAAIIIGLYVRDQFSYDRWIPDYERIARIGEVYNMPGRPHLVVDMTMPTIGPLLKTALPSLAAVARLQRGDAAIMRGDTEGSEAVAWADPAFFDIFALPAIAGDLQTALARPDGIVLTRTAARKYFGRDDPVGETINVNRHPMRVAAVLEDLPANTHLPNQIIASGEASFSPLYRLDRHPDADSVYTYVRRAPGASLGALRQAILDFEHRYINVSSAAGPISLSLEVVPIADIHLKPAGLIPMKPSGDRDTLYAIAAIAVLTVLVAAINFANLMAARAMQRAIEVGVRKTTGARRRDLIFQFLGESFLSVCLAMALALALVESFLPAFAAFMNSALHFEYWRDPELIAGIALLIGTIGFAAGLYPAFVLSAFRPATALKRSPTQAHPGTVRFSLVVLQFSVLIIALVTTGTIFRQMQFALSEAMRVNQDQVLLINGGCTKAFKDAVASLPGVRSAACAGGTALSMGFSDAGVQLTDGTILQSRQSQVDFGFFELYGLKPLAGRLYERNHADDAVVDGATANPSIVLNQSAVKKFRFASAVAAVGQSILWTRHEESDDFAAPQRSTIIGVVQDFSMNSVRERIEPQIYYIDPKLFTLTNVKLDGARIPETLVSIDRLWRTLNADKPVNRLFLDEMMRRKYLDIIRQGEAFTLFTAIALLIACVGLFGLALSTAERRTKEIGIRKSMGASTGNILHLLTWEFAKPVIWANIIAWPIAYFAMSRWLDGFAYHVSLPPWMFAAAGALALVIALATISIQSLLTARAKPVTALRDE